MFNTKMKKYSNDLCRVCLTTSKNLLELTMPIPLDNKYKDISSIHMMLEEVTFTKVCFDAKLPSQICQMCLSVLKIAYDFQKGFYKSQKKIDLESNGRRKENVDHISLCESDVLGELPRPEVELICGNSKFNLDDVLVIEEELKETDRFDGFLKKLGSEVSASFTKEGYDCHKIHDQIEPISTLFLKNNNLFESQSIELLDENSKENCELLPVDVSKVKVKRLTGDELIEVSYPSPEGALIVKTLYECRECKKMELNKIDLDMHKYAQHSCVCEKCGYIAQTKRKLYTHSVNHREKLFQCPLCPKSYKEQPRLNTHLKLHRNKGAYLCNVCGKAFSYRLSLIYHLRLHESKRFSCNICGVRFTMPNALKRHIRTHTKEKPYECNYCVKKFASRSEQVSHERLHTGERPYHCEYCGRRFIKSGTLKAHYLTHPGPHECDSCAKSFINVAFLNDHIQKFHTSSDLDTMYQECNYFL